METADFNKSTIEVLTDFAHKTNRLTEFSEMAYPSSINQPVLHRKTIYIKNNSANLSCFVAFHDPKAFGDMELFCGVFLPVPIPASTKARIQKKSILDNFNLFSKKKSIKTGLYQFDSEFTISGDDTSGLELFLQNRILLEKLMESFQISENFFISFNEFVVDFVPDFTGKSYISLITTQKWIVDESIIEKLFSQVELFSKEFSL